MWMRWFLSVCADRDRTIRCWKTVLIGVLYQSLRTISQSVDGTTGYRLIHSQAFRLPKKPPVHAGAFYTAASFSQLDDLSKILTKFNYRLSDKIFSMSEYTMKILKENDYVWLISSIKVWSGVVQKMGSHKQKDNIKKALGNKDFFLSLSMLPLMFLLLPPRYL